MGCCRHASCLLLLLPELFLSSWSMPFPSPLHHCTSPFPSASCLPQFPHPGLPGRDCSRLGWAVGRCVTLGCSAGWGGFAPCSPGMRWMQAESPAPLPKLVFSVPSLRTALALQPTVPHCWHPKGDIAVSRVFAAPTGATCVPTPPLLCKRPPSPRHLPALTWWPPIVMAGVQAAKSYGTSAPAAALPIPDATSLLGCSIWDS